MAILKSEGGRLIRQQGTELLWIEPWGDGLRVRATRLAEMPKEDWALMPFKTDAANINVNEKEASISKGGITARLNRAGWLSFYNAKG
jgi:alpha-D-xyloside xylohydrolase